MTKFLTIKDIRAKLEGSRRYGAAALLLLLFLLGINWKTGVLLLENTDTGQTLFISSIHPGDEFSLWFINSQDRFPMSEEFEIQEDYGIHLARIGTDYEIAGNPWAYPDIRHIDDKRDNPYLFFSGSRDLTRHAFIFGESRVDLWRQPHQLMKISVGDMSLLSYSWGWFNMKISSH